MQLKIGVILWTGGILGVGAVALLALIVGAFTMEARVSELYSAFAVLGDRAIQIDRLGEYLQISETRAKLNIPPEIIAHPDLLNCDSDLHVHQFDPSQEKVVNVLLADPWRPTVYLIYSGKAPDFSRFLNKGDEFDSTLFSALKIDPEIDFNGASRQDSFLLPYNAVIRDNNFTWQSRECEFFTYTIIEGK